jgi:hypothetical protein
MFKFYHCRLDMAATRAQDDLVTLMMAGINNVYFTGGYTTGAGLHEECWISGTQVVQHVIDPNHQNPHRYQAAALKAGGEVRHAAPKYLVDLL